MCGSATPSPAALTRRELRQAGPSLPQLNEQPTVDLNSPSSLPPAAPLTRRALRESGDLTLTRSERRERRHRDHPSGAGPRVGARVAKGAVAVGLAFGVGGFTAAAERGAQESPEVVAEPVTPVLTPTALAERRDAAGQASAVAAEAQQTRSAAEAAAVSADSVATLERAINELGIILTTAQQTQPAVTHLAPVTETEDVPVVVQSSTAATEALTTAQSAQPAPASSASEAAAETETVSDPAAAQLLDATERVRTLTQQIQVVTEIADQAAAEEAARVAAEEAARQEAEALAAAQAEAERRAAQAASLDAYENGRIPSEALCGLDFTSGQLRCDAAEALNALNQAYRAQFGADMIVSDTYRSYAAQVACVAAKGALCATPGTSNHGNGTAVDLGGKLSSFGTTQHGWLLEHAQEYGWDLPSWARANGSKPEPWHWEFTA